MNANDNDPMICLTVRQMGFLIVAAEVFMRACHEVPADERTIEDIAVAELVCAVDALAAAGAECCARELASRSSSSPNSPAA